jgi:hypothetical protein
MTRDRNDSGKGGKPRAAAGGKRTPPAKAQARGTRGETDKKKAAPPKASAPPRTEAPARRPARPEAPPAGAAPAPPVKPVRAARPKPSPARARKSPPAEKVAPRAPRAAAAKARPAPAVRKVEADIDDEQRIESAKYLTAEQPARVFEEERFIFPETYGRNRVRLLVKDPQWLFAHWDVDPEVISRLRSEMGERAAALARLTLKVTDPEHGGGAVIHLPEDARSWYVRADRVRRAYRAELGLTLPSGEYRLLAASNTVRTPAGTASPRRASRRARYEGPHRPLPADPGGSWPRAEAPPALTPAKAAAPPAPSGDPGPWHPRLVEARPGSPAAGDAPEKGGASDIHRR